MTQPEDNIIDSSCWQLLSSGNEDTKKIQTSVDGVFSSYSFYPELDWKKFGYSPPDGHQVLGAWRHPDAVAFAFLLDNPLMQKSENYSQFLLYVVGIEREISLIDKRIKAMKKNLRKDAFKTAQAIGAASRLDQMAPSRSIGVFTGIVTFFTAIVNAYSYYLRTLPPPQLGTEFQQALYSLMLSTVYFLSLGLLIAVTIVCALFLTKYAFILIKRL